MQQFVRRLHPVVSQRIATHILHEVDKVPIERALPKSFSPDELKQTLEDFIDYAKLPTDILEKTPRQYQQKSSQAVRAIQHTPSAIPENTADDDIDLPAIVAALNNTTTAKCFLCDASDHRMAQCSIYLRLRDNPRAITTLLRQLKPRRQRGPPREIRQITDEKSTTEIGEGSTPSADIFETGEGYLEETTSTDDATVSPAIDTLESDFL
jgi:hypothetical protein